MTLANQENLPALTGFIVVKALPAWTSLGFGEQLVLLQAHVEPVLQRYHEQVRLLMYDVEKALSSAATDIWVWESTDRAAYNQLMVDLQKTPFWGRYFEVLDMLDGARGDAIFQLSSWQFRTGVPVME
ncbi:darcynin family protein [Massilia sp. NR 4-1]|uniref:darcynin family protein n=1 Tax=Massilia sp. NR 4-1 TaxID=1678028 RepID=UPI00067AFE2F|nr:darcynin family protein [Massilia sp. NR 4-1]